MIEEQIKEIFERNTEVVKTKIKNGELWESFVFTEGLVKELSDLLTQQREEAVKGFIEDLDDRVIYDKDELLGEFLTQQSLDKGDGE